MLRFVRAGLAAAFLALVLSPATAAEKLFKQSSLDEAAIKLEAQIKSDAGTVAKPPAALRRDIDAAFQKNDFRTGMLVLGQLVTVAPDDASSWLRLSRTILQIKPRDDREKALLLDRASTAAYIAYGRAGDRNLEADSLSVLGRTLADREQWRGALNAMRASLELRETADLRGQYEKLRSEHGFRLLDFTVDADSISPRACFQFSEDLPGRRTDFACLGGKGAAEDHRRRGAAHRCCALSQCEHIDPGGCLARVGRPRTHQAAQRNFARRQRRVASGRPVSHSAPG